MVKYQEKKKYGHTKTLFKKGGKFQWSYKFEHCIKCLTCDSKHKGKGLCNKCYDKYRKTKGKRKFNLAKQNWIYYFKNRIKLFLTKKKHNRSNGPKRKYFGSRKDYLKKRYNKHKIRLIAKQVIKKRLDEGLPCMTVMIEEKEIYLPFEGLGKKPMVMKSKKREEWKRKQIIFDRIMNFENNKKIL